HGSISSVLDPKQPTHPRHAFSSGVISPPVGVNNHIAPSKSPPSASNAPPDSLPAIGCPGKKLAVSPPANSCCASSTISSLVLPTSVTSCSGRNTGASNRIQS